jgi:hypothetical protein
MVLAQDVGSGLSILNANFEQPTQQSLKISDLAAMLQRQQPG